MISVVMKSSVTCKILILLLPQWVEMVSCQTTCSSAAYSLRRSAQSVQTFWLGKFWCNTVKHNYITSDTLKICNEVCTPQCCSTARLTAKKWKPSCYCWTKWLKSLSFIHTELCLRLDLCLVLKLTSLQEPFCSIAQSVLGFWLIKKIIIWHKLQSNRNWPSIK